MLHNPSYGIQMPQIHFTGICFNFTTFDIPSGATFFCIPAALYEEQEVRLSMNLAFCSPPWSVTVTSVKCIPSAAMEVPIHIDVNVGAIYLFPIVRIRIFLSVTGSYPLQAGSCLIHRTPQIMAIKKAA